MQQQYNLLRDGVCVVPCAVMFDVHEFSRTLHEFAACQGDVPVSPPSLALGGFGAMGTPSSFHHPAIRDLRRQCFEQMFPRFVQWHPGKNLQLMFDRFSQRVPGKSLTPESWHRDVGIHPIGDIIYGGWINLDPDGSPNQHFSCIPGNFLKPTEKYASGFVKFDPNDKNLMSQLNAEKTIISIPPKHMILFNQTLAHEVFKHTFKFVSHRLYLGWRITDSTENLYDFIVRTRKPDKDDFSKIFKPIKDPPPNSFETIIHDQALPSIGSGQMPAMFGKNHWSYEKNTNNIEKFTLTLKPLAILKNPTRPELMLRFLPSLKDAGLMYAPYTEQDVDILRIHPLNAAAAAVAAAVAHEDVNDVIDDVDDANYNIFIAPEFPPNKRASDSESESPPKKRASRKRRRIMPSSSSSSSSSTQKSMADFLESTKKRVAKKASSNTSSTAASRKRQKKTPLTRKIEKKSSSNDVVYISTEPAAKKVVPHEVIYVSSDEFPSPRRSISVLPPPKQKQKTLADHFANWTSHKLP